MIDLIFKLTPVVFSCLTLLVSIAIKFNDMRHLDEDIKEIKKQVDSINKKLDNHEQRISRIEGRLNGYSTK